MFACEVCLFNQNQSPHAIVLVPGRVEYAR
jgi:hypothetical protein